MKHNQTRVKTRSVIATLCLMMTSHGYSAETDDLTQNSSSAVHAQNQRYVVTGHQTREVELRVIPEVWAHHPRYCSGHWQQSWGMHHYYCSPGCRGGETYLAQPKRVEVVRDVWKGCEELEHYIALNQAERSEEEPIVSNETRVIDGFPVTKETWERTVTYVLKSHAFRDYSADHAVI